MKEQDPNIRILYADGNQDSQDMVLALLDISHIDVTAALTVSDAERLTLLERFDMILLDTHFPDGSGLDLCRRLRSRAFPVPVIFYSGDAFAADSKNGLSAGASRYITKPNSDELASAILYAVGRTGRPA